MRMLSILHSLLRAFLHFVITDHNFVSERDNKGKCFVCKFEIFRVKDEVE